MLKSPFSSRISQLARFDYQMVNWVDDICTVVVSPKKSGDCLNMHNATTGNADLEPPNMGIETSKQVGLIKKQHNRKRRIRDIII